MNFKLVERVRVGNIVLVQEGVGKEGFLEEMIYQLNLYYWYGMGYVDARKGEDRVVGFVEEQKLLYFCQEGSKKILWGVLGLKIFYFQSKG